MRALILTLALGGAALAQSSTLTVPALPPGSSGTSTGGTSTSDSSSTGTSDTSTTSTTSTSATSTVPASITLRFAPTPGTALEYVATVTQQFQVGRLSLQPKPNVRLTAEKEKERKTLEARLQKEFPKSLPQGTPQTSKQFVRVQPPLADGSQVVLQTVIVQGAKSPVAVRLEQTLKPDGTVSVTILEPSDPMLRRVFSGLLAQFKTNIGGSELSFFGRPLVPGEASARVVNLDLGQLLGGLIPPSTSGSVAGTISADVTTTYTGQDTGGNARFDVASRFKDTSLSVKVRDVALQFAIKAMSSSAQTLVRPDGLAASSSTHTDGSMVMTFDLPGEPYQMIIDVKITQDSTTALR